MTTSRAKLRQGLSEVNQFHVMSVVARAQKLEQQGQDIVHMEVGEPDFSTAEPIIEAGVAALRAGLTQYTPAPGIFALREAVAELYQRRHGVTLSAERVFITPGASAGLSLLATLLVSPGDQVLIPDPSYPCVRNFIRLMSAEPGLVPVGVEENFQPTIDLLQQNVSKQTSGLWLASPANPSGTVLDRASLENFSRWCRLNDLHLLVDEIYHGLHYVEDLPSALEVDDECFVVNSFSKYFGMTGWRLGWIVVPESYQEKANTLAQNMYISASSIAQYAALAAFSDATSEILERRRRSFRERRDFMQKELGLLGFGQVPEIQGAFYSYADISAFSDDSMQFCRNVLEQYGVAVTPGADFGEYKHKQFVRFAFTTDMTSLEKGIERLAKAIARG